MFALLFSAMVVANATEPIPTIDPQDTETRSIYSVEGWYETSSGYMSSFSIGSNLYIPKGTTSIVICIESPTLSSYSVSTTSQGVTVSSNSNYISMYASGSNTLGGKAITISGYCPATGANETFTIVMIENL